ncbi:uncharacterized protein Z518_09606 [Rhinocladiella mackenziei CBS 650.93]|uniref:Rhinocladiella mackenziei CBS 650.93 unplaced genomic scaffold supercont1.7, whole genome shotgun sequence n=1 Tax=Rhinocladiella mackenziei CBS 650.93 TaxID=1442369 RepID=A0A0D2I7Q2_9EURO|nr:uncharacterized protein Z518_09606 [Rhinocladiella mackenziei CBS 650.93]KIX01879.1 hypothetical protein Z518_09606 [Rhinocladiella mackenziei CBS 650.93]
MLSLSRFCAGILPWISFVTGWNLTARDFVSWDRPRAALIRDHVYLEGGRIHHNLTDIVTSSDGFLFKLNLHRSFGISGDSPPAVFESIDEGPITNYYVDGFMFADYDEFYAYGGLFDSSGNTQTDRTVSCPLYDAPEGSNVQLGEPNTNYAPQSGSFISDIASGAGANAPSENLGFYFSGMYNEDGTPFSYFGPPRDISNWLIQVDTSIQGAADWRQLYINQASNPVNVTLRVEGALVWVPASTQGLLIAIGGVVNASDLHFYGPTDDNATESMGFLKEFPVYDIGSASWSLQTLNEGSPFPDTPLVQFCTVVASSPDGSHHEIFVYGGWDNNGGSPKNDVWILTVPSFTWIKADSPGRTGDARQGHVCASPYPDQMIVIGGTSLAGSPLDTSNTVDVYNLNELNWTGSYDPDIHQPYQPHQTVLDVISATPTAGNMPSDIAGWFDTKYNMDKIKFYGPYQKVSETTPSPPPSNATTSATPSPAPNSDRPWVVPVAATLGTVGGLALVGALIFFCCCRGRFAKRRGENQEAAEVSQRRSWIVPWIWSTSSGAPGKDVTSDTITEVEHPSSPLQTTIPQELEGGYVAQSDGRGRDRWSSSTHVRSPPGEYAAPVEAQDTAVHEVPGTSRINSADDINYDFRNMAMYPPSVVSGGHLKTLPSESISPPNESSTNAPASPHTTSAAAPSSPRDFPTIPETDIALSGAVTDNQGSERAVSPLTARQTQRPGHGRRHSSMSSGMSLPSPNIDQSALPRPRASRSASGEDGETVSDRQGSHTL